MTSKQERYFIARIKDHEKRLEALEKAFWASGCSTCPKDKHNGAREPARGGMSEQAGVGASQPEHRSPRSADLGLSSPGRAETLVEESKT